MVVPTPNIDSILLILSTESEPPFDGDRNTEFGVQHFETWSFLAAKLLSKPFKVLTRQPCLTRGRVSCVPYELIREILFHFYNQYTKKQTPGHHLAQQLHTMAHKRSHSGLDDHISQPNKATKIDTIPVATDALLSANTRITELEHQVQELQAFINANGLTRSVCLLTVLPKTL